MAKTIGFCGASYSGKTSMCFKTALETYRNTSDISVAFLSPDITSPVMALLFPNYNKDSIHSLSTILDNAVITPEAVLEGMITIKGMRNFGCIGFTKGENKFSFPTPTAEKIDELFTSISSLVDYIFVDCSMDMEELITRKTLSEADVLVRCVAPDLRCVNWYESSKTLMRSEEEHLYNLVVDNEKDVNLDISGVLTHFKSNTLLIPYCHLVKQQMLEGKLYEKIPNTFGQNRKFNIALKKLMDAVIKDEPLQITYDDAGANANENFDNIEYEGGVMVE